MDVTCNPCDTGSFRSGDHICSCEDGFLHIVFKIMKANLFMLKNLNFSFLGVKGIVHLRYNQFSLKRRINTKATKETKVQVKN
jgi:hypothetical protein